MDSFAPSEVKLLAEIDPAHVPYEQEFVVIQGVLAESQSGCPGRDENHAVHFFTFEAWRYPEEPIEKCRLTILRLVVKESDYFSEFAAYGVIRVRVLLSVDHTRAVCQTVLEMNRDEELEAVARDLQIPLVIETRHFGGATLNRRFDWFEGQAEWNEQSIPVQLMPDKDRSIEGALATADVLWSDPVTWKRRIDDFAVQELLELKNDVWLEGGETKLTAKQFVASMKLESIALFPDGEFEFWHDDGELFWGHAIQIRGNVNDGPTVADIPG